MSDNIHCGINLDPGVSLVERAQRAILRSDHLTAKDTAAVGAFLGQAKAIDEMVALGDPEVTRKLLHGPYTMFSDMAYKLGLGPHMEVSSGGSESVESPDRLAEMRQRRGRA